MRREIDLVRPAVSNVAGDTTPPEPETTADEEKDPEKLAVNAFERYPFMPPEIQVESDVNMMIMQIREEIFEKTIEKALKNYIESLSIPLALHFIRESLRKIINWMFFAKEDQDIDTTWVPCSEPEPSPIDNFCSGIVTNLDEGLEAEFTKEVPKLQDIDNSLGSISSLPYALQEEVSNIISTKKTPQKMKKKEVSKLESIATEEPKNAFANLSIRSKSNLSKLTGISEMSRPRHKYVKQLANYIHPRAFQRNL